MIVFIRYNYVNKIAPEPKPVMLDYSSSDSYLEFFKSPV